MGQAAGSGSVPSLSREEKVLGAEPSRRGKRALLEAHGQHQRPKACPAWQLPEPSERDTAATQQRWRRADRGRQGLPQQPGGGGGGRVRRATEEKERVPLLTAQDLRGNPSNQPVGMKVEEDYLCNE